MAPPRKASLQTAVSTAASKGKKVATGGTTPMDPHPTDPNIVLERVGEEHLSPSTIPERVANEHKFRLPTEGQLLQMLACL